MTPQAQQMDALEWGAVLGAVTGAGWSFASGQELEDSVFTTLLTSAIGAVIGTIIDTKFASVGTPPAPTPTAQYPVAYTTAPHPPGHTPPAAQSSVPSHTR